MVSSVTVVLWYIFFTCVSVASFLCGNTKDCGGEETSAIRKFLCGMGDKYTCEHNSQMECQRFACRIWMCPVNC